LAFVLVRNALNAHGDDTVAKLRVVEGPNVGLVLRLVEPERAYLIGRAGHCDLSLADPDCSREHASIIRRAGQIFLRDHGSSHGVVLGGSRIPARCDVPWRSSFMARIGSTVLALDEPVAAALASLEAAVDEQLADKDVPAPPPQHRSRPPSARSATPASLAASSRVSSRPSASPRMASLGKGKGSENSDDGKDSHALPANNAPAAGSVAPAAADALAPMVHLEGSSSPPPRPIRRGKRKVTVIDVVVVTLAVVIIGASMAGLAWVLK